VVDLDEDTINKLRNFRLSYNRHKGSYQITENNYNQMLYQTKYYYEDQYLHHVSGDEYFLRKVWRRRTPFKKYVVMFTTLFVAVSIHSHFHMKRHQKARAQVSRMIKQTFEFPKMKALDSPVKIEVEGTFVEANLKELAQGYNCTMVLRTDDVAVVKTIVEVANEFKSKMSSKRFKICLLVLLSEKGFKSIDEMRSKFNSEVFPAISNISFLKYDYNKDDLREKDLHYFIKNSIVFLKYNQTGHWGTRLDERIPRSQKDIIRNYLAEVAMNDSMRVKTEKS
jgi:hypothetical protein